MNSFFAVMEGGRWEAWMGDSGSALMTYTFRQSVLLKITFGNIQVVVLWDGYKANVYCN